MTLYLIFHLEYGKLFPRNHQHPHQTSLGSHSPSSLLPKTRKILPRPHPRLQLTDFPKCTSIVIQDQSEKEILANLKYMEEVHRSLER